MSDIKKRLFSDPEQKTVKAGTYVALLAKIVEAEKKVFKDGVDTGETLPGLKFDFIVKISDEERAEVSRVLPVYGFRIKNDRATFNKWCESMDYEGFLEACASKDDEEKLAYLENLTGRLWQVKLAKVQGQPDKTYIQDVFSLPDNKSAERIKPVEKILALELQEKEPEEKHEQLPSATFDDDDIPF